MTEPIGKIPPTDERLVRARYAMGLSTYEDVAWALNEVDVLREQMSTMHNSVVHDCCVAVEQVKVLADTIQEEIAPFTKAGDRTVADRIRGALVVKP